MRRRTVRGLALFLAAAAAMAPAQAATWLPGVRVSEADPNLVSPEGVQVVVDAAGTATAVWWELERTSGLGFVVEVRSASRAAGAAAFGPSQRLGTGRDPQVVVHPDGAVTVAWLDGVSLWATTREAGEDTFPAAEAVVTPQGDKSPNAAVSMSVDGRGNVWVSWPVLRGDSDLPVGTCRSATRIASSGTWSEGAPVVGGLAISDCNVEAARDGTVTYAWAGNGSVWTRTRSAEGVLGDQVLADDSAGARANLALTDNAQGVTLLSWTRDGTGLLMRLRAETDGLFQAKELIAEQATAGGDVPLVVDDDGLVSGGWVAADGGVVGITRADDGTVTRTPLSVSGRFALGIDAVADRHGAVTLVWQQAGGSYFVAASRRGADGTWEPPAALTDVQNGRAVEPAVGVAPTGDVTAVYAYSADPSRVAPHVRSQVLDVSAPTLTAAIPATAAPGSAVTMAASPVDVWGPVTVAWTFGDGATATGTSPTHAYAALGTYQVRVTATDGSGNTATLTDTVTVQPPAAPVGDRTSPALSRALLTPDQLPTGHGARLKLTSTEAGRLVGVVERRRADGQWREVGTKHWALTAGRSSKTFYGQAAQQRLTEGKHRVRLVASDAAGNTSIPVVLTFRVGPR